MKKTLSFILSLSLLSSACTSFTASAEKSEKDAELNLLFTFNDLVEMSDSEYIEFSDFKQRAGGDNKPKIYHDINDKNKTYELDCVFGVDYVSDTEKYSSFDYIFFRYAPYDIIQIIEEEKAVQELLKVGDNRYEALFIPVSVDRYTELDPSFNASFLGLPEDWKVIPQEFIDLGADRKYQAHWYKIYVPIEVLEDFEQFDRLLYALDAVYEESNKHIVFNEQINDYDTDLQYGINWVGSIWQKYFAYSSGVSNLYGDANLDYEVNLADSVLVMQHFANPAKYSIDKWGTINADMDGDGLNIQDAFIIQKKILNADEKK